MPPVRSPLVHDVLKFSLSFLICLILFFLTFFLYTKAAGPLPFKVDSISTQKLDNFYVTGTGKSSIKPDKGTVRVGVNSTGKTADEAKSKMNEVINRVSSALKALGISEADIKTENLSVYPIYNDVKPLVMQVPELMPVGTTPPNPDGKATSYNGNTTIVITVRKIDLANQVIDTATAQGANQLGGVQFDNTDTTAAENDARIKAIADAKQKAQTAAQAAGFKLGKLLNYQENAGGNVAYYDKAMPMAASGRAEDSAPTQIEPGENEVSMTVTLSYEVL